MTAHMNRYFPVKYTGEELVFAKGIQKAMGKPEDGMTDKVLPAHTGVEFGGSSDVGDVSWNVPTMGAVYASWPLHIPPHQWGCTACHGMSIGRKAGIRAAHVLAAAGLDLITDANLLKEAQAEFEKKRAGKPCKSLNDVKKSPSGKLSDKDLAHYECCIHAAMEHFGIKEHQ
jgi:aminobenzoyl-glutamate utilization protein B